MYHCDECHDTKRCPCGGRQDGCQCGGTAECPSCVRGE